MSTDDLHASRALPLLLLLGALLFLGPAVGQPPDEPAPTAEAAETTEQDLEALIRILEDDEARARLLERLRASAADAPSEDAPFPTGAQRTLARELAEYTREAAEGAAAIFGAMGAVFQHVTDLLSGDIEIDLRALGAITVNVALVVTVTFGAFLLLRFAFSRWQRRAAEAAASDGFVLRTRMVAGSAVLDALTVAAAWGIGYAAALGLGTAGQMGINQTLFLNAFLLIELIKVGARAVLAPRWPALRVGPMDDTTAAYWYFWCSRLVSMVGYTFMFIAPILATGVSVAVAEAVRVVVLFSALAIAAAITLQNRDRVREVLMRRAREGRTDTFTRALAAVAGFWHILVIVYLIVVYALWLADHEGALPFVLAATVQTVIAIAVGIVVSSAIARFAEGGMRLPDDVKQRLPLLEQRLNAFVPNVLQVVRIVIAVGVLLIVAQVWGLADLARLLSTELGQRVVTALLSSALILLVAGVIYLAVQSWVEYRLNPNFGTVPTARERTLLSLFRNAFTIVLAVIVAMLVLSELGVNIGPLLAGAGVVGLAVGFGAQKLVQDIINGVFIQFENSMNEGDMVAAGGVTGIVERLTVRSVSLRSLDGTYHVIPFSSVESVSNLSKTFSYHVAAIGVAYRESIADVKEAMHEAFNRLKQTELGQQDIIDELDMQGVTEFADSAVVVRARIKTLPGRQWAVGRAYNEVVKEVFDQRDIEIPFPHVTLYMGQDKQGKAPPLRIEAEALAGAERTGEQQGGDVRGPRKSLSPRARATSADPSA